MKANRITLALVAAGLLTAAVVVVGVSSPAIGVEGVFGFAAVLALITIGVSDYRSAGRLFSK